MQYIEFDDADADIWTYVSQAIEKYDRFERFRVKQYNTHLAIYIARRRLRHWTKHGFHGWPSLVPGDDDSELMAQFKEIKTALRAFGEWVKTRKREVFRLEKVVAELSASADEEAKADFKFVYGKADSMDARARYLV